MAVTRRLVKGSPLTAQEHDGNVDAFDKYKGTYTNLAALQAAHPSPNDADYAYSTDGTTRFYALNSTWQQEQLSVSYTAAEQYASINDLLDAQSAQIDQRVYEVVDASSDPNVVSRDNFTAHYLYIGGTTETLSDYQLQPQAQSSVDTPFDDYGSLNEMLASQGSQKRNYAYYIENDSKVYVYKGIATGSTADYAVLGGEALADVAYSNDYNDLDNLPDIDSNNSITSPAPNQLQPNSIGLGFISLKWESVNDYHEIFRSLDNVTFSKVGESYSNVFTDASVSADTEYLYKVKSHNSLYSNTLKILSSDTESVSLFQRMAVSGVIPAFNRVAIIRGLKDLLSNNILAQTDFLNVFSSHSEATAFLNWKTDSNNTAKAGSPIFEANKGFKGNGLGGLRTDYNVLNDSSQLSENNLIVAVLTLEQTQENPALFEASSDSYSKRILINPENASGNYSVKVNASGGGVSTAPDITIGLHILKRTSSTTFEYWLNDTLIDTITNTSNGLPNADIWTLARALDDVPDDYSNRQAALIMAGSGNINPTDLVDSIKGFMGVLTGYNTIDWQGATTGNYPILPTSSNQTKVTTFYPTTVNVETYNHHPHIIEHNGAIYLQYSTANINEEDPGEYMRWQKSRDGGTTWTTPSVLFSPPDDLNKGFNVFGRVCIPAGWAIVDGKLYGLSDMNDKGAGNSSRDKVGVLAVELKSDDTLGIPFWIANQNGSDTSPAPIEGYPAHNFDKKLSTEIINYLLEPYLNPTWFYSVPDDHPLQTGGGRNGITEPTVCELPDGRYMKLWRKVEGNRKIKAVAFSYDGINYGGVLDTNIPDWDSRSHLVRLSDGRITLVGNNVNPNSQRNPLFFAQSVDGLEWKANNVYNLDSFSDPIAFTGTYKTIGAQYPHSILLANGKICCAYSLNKEGIRVSVFDAPDIN